MAVLIVIVPAAASHSTAAATQTTESDFAAGTTAGSTVVANGVAGAVSHDTANSSAVARYPLDNGTGTTAYDFVNDHDGAITGASWISGVRGQAVSFDGVDDSVEVNDDLTLSTWTIAAWVKTTENGTVLSRRDSSSGNTANYQIEIVNGKARISYYDTSASTFQFVDSTTRVDDGNWHLVVGTFDGSTLEGYVNGSSFGTTSGGTPYTDSTDSTWLGKRPDNDDFMDVDVDEARIYNSALNQSQVSNLSDNPAAKLSPATTSSFTSASMAVTNSVSGTVELTMHNVTVDVEWQGSSDGGTTWTTLSTATYSTSGSHTQSWSEFSGDDVRYIITFSEAHTDHFARVDAASVDATTHEPTVDNSSLTPNTTGSTVNSVPVTLEANVSDVDFSTQQDDTLNVSFYVDGDYRKSVTATANGTVSTSVDATAGDHDWHITVEDDYGHKTTSATAQFRVPSEIKIHSETNTSKLVKDATVTITFYGTTNNDTFVRETSTGTLNMTGLPAGKEFVVFAEADGWYSRRIIIDSLTDQQHVFLLNKSEPAANVTFTLDDQTGRFPSKNTKLYIRRSTNLTNDSSPVYRTIAGDYFGASEEFPVALEEGGRYVLIVESTEGGTRDLGPYIAEDSGEVQLSIGEVTFDIGGEDQDYTWGTEYDPNNDQANLNATVQFTFSDPTDSTSNLCLTIYERGNESNTLTDRCHSGPYGNFTFTTELTKAQEDKTWVANWTADRNGGQISGKQVFGDNAIALGWSLDPIWEKLLMGLLIVFIAGFFSDSMAHVGAVVTAGAGAVLWAMGIFPVELGIILGAMTLAVLARMAQSGGLDST